MQLRRLADLPFDRRGFELEQHVCEHWILTVKLMQREVHIASPRRQ